MESLQRTRLRSLGQRCCSLRSLFLLPTSPRVALLRPIRRWPCGSSDLSLDAPRPAAVDLEVLATADPALWRIASAQTPPRTAPTSTSRASWPDVPRRTSLGWAPPLQPRSAPAGLLLRGGAWNGRMMIRKPCCREGVFMIAPAIPLKEFDQEMTSTRKLLERVPR